VAGETDKMIVLTRSNDGDQYVCETGLAPLEDIANGVKMLPKEWINEDGVSMNYQFFKYASPLIKGEVQVPHDHGIPQYVTLSKNRVSKMLGEHKFD
jgi:hypothetical protein